MSATDSAHRNASELSGLTSRTVSAHTELVTRQGQSRHASAAETFTASYSSKYSSSITASSLITWESAIFDKGLITPWSKISQEHAADGRIEKIEGGGDCRLQLTRCGVEIQRLSLHVETIKEGEPREVLYALLHGNFKEGDYGLAMRMSCQTRDPLCASGVEGSGLFRVLRSPLLCAEGGGDCRLQLTR